MPQKKQRHTIGWVWFTPGGIIQKTIGIVITINEMDETKAYIGFCLSEQETEHESVIYIAQWGSKFPLEQAQQIISDKGKLSQINIPT